MPAPPITAGPNTVHVAVLDTGLQMEPGANPMTPRSPWFQARVVASPSWSASTDPVVVDDDDEPDADGDGGLDLVAGHGTFICGLVLQHAPGVRLHTRGAITSFGDGDDFSVAAAVDAVLAEVPADEPVVLNLSLGGYTEDDEEPLAFAELLGIHADRDMVIVASAGNDAVGRPTWPAAFPEVVGVGALGPHGPAPFTNFGSWVDCCAPGVDIVSRFLDPADGRPEFDGWASWSGTSFAAPIVAALIAREVQRDGITTAQARDRILSPTHGAAIPGLGTIVAPTP